MSLRADVVVTRGPAALDLSLEVESGQLVAVLGPNGAGKTTLLHTLAGLLPLGAGRIELGDTVLDDPAAGVFVPPEQRPIGVVFQDHALFPHLSALDNIAFGLRAAARRSRRDARTRASAWLERVGLSERAAARPAELSGGQAQRVALARALATEPELLLLDEPLAALDAHSRSEVRRELRRHLATFTGVRILVTHDPIDAFALADRVVVVEDGRITHDGTPHDVTSRPRTPYVAELAGTNLYSGRARDGDVHLDNGVVLTTTSTTEGDVYAVIHPAAVALYRSRPDGSPRNAWPLHVVHVDRLGPRVRVELAGALPIVADVTPAAVAALDLRDGAQTWAAVKATEISVTPR